MKTFKICKLCKLEKELNSDNFRRQSATKDGFKSYCKPCDDEYNKKNYRTNADSRIEKIKTWQAANPEKIKKYQKKYRAKKRPEQI